MGAGNTGNTDKRNKERIGGTESANAKVDEKAIESGSAGTESGTESGTASGDAASAGTERTARPAKAGNSSTVNPTEIAPDDYERDEFGKIVYRADGVTPRRKRGRKPGQVTGEAKQASAPKKVVKQGDRGAMATEMLAAQFQILNTGIAFLTQFDDFKLSDGEAMQMASATANVMEQFDYVPDPKVAAVLGLVTTTSMIYGPRVWLYRSHKEKQRKEKLEKNRIVADEKAATGEIPHPFNLGQFNG